MSSADILASLGRARHARVSPSPEGKPRRASALPIWQTRVLGWSVLVTLIVLWQWIATVAPSPGLPAPTRIANAWVSGIIDGDLFNQLCDTLASMAYGFSMAVVLGIVVGVLMARVKVVYGLLEPFVELWRPIPSIIFIPVIILYVGLGQPMNIFVIVISAAEPVVLNAFGGARSISPVLLSTAATFRLTWWQTLREIVLPSALPQIMVGLRLALAKSLVIAVGAGMIAGDSGIGFYVVTAQQTLDIPKMFAGAFTVAMVGYVLNAVFVLVERRFLHWHDGTKAQAGV